MKRRVLKKRGARDLAWRRWRMRRRRDRHDAWELARLEREDAAFIMLLTVGP